jgi:hypothetical protein
MSGARKPKRRFSADFQGRSIVKRPLKMAENCYFGFVDIAGVASSILATPTS